MKKITIIILIGFLLGCSKTIDKEKELYNNYIEELKQVETSSNNIPFEINFNIENINDDYLSYTVLLDRKEINMTNIEAIVIHNKESENIFPSLGILENPISLTDKDSIKGIKLIGYIEKQNNITFKFMIKYINEEKKEEKYYYIYNYRQ